MTRRLDPRKAYQPAPSPEEVRLRLIEAILVNGEPHGYITSIIRSVAEAETFIFGDPDQEMVERAKLGISAQFQAD